MRRSWMLTAAAALVALPAALAAQDPIAEYKAVGARAARPVATVSYGVDPLQTADLRLPAGKGPFPVAVVIHGGCWTAGFDDKRGIAGFAEALGKRGFATWTIEYRQSGNPGGGWPGTFTDVAQAIDKLAEVAPKYGLDMRRVTFVGHSAGAHLALWAASRPRLPAPWNAAKVRAASVVAIDGPATLAPFVGVDAKVCGKPVIVPLMGGTPADRPTEYGIASPADHLPLGMPQLMVGGSLTPFMKPYVAAARAAGDPVEMIEPKGADHFDIMTPGKPNGNAVIDFIATRALPPAAPKRR